MASEFDPVEEASEESFPASDPPAWTMGEESTHLAVVNNSARHRFEASIDGNTAFLDYRRTPHMLTLVHTEVPESMRSHGAGMATWRALRSTSRDVKGCSSIRCVRLSRLTFAGIRNTRIWFTPAIGVSRNSGKHNSQQAIQVWRKLSPLYARILRLRFGNSKKLRKFQEAP